MCYSLNIVGLAPISRVVEVRPVCASNDQPNFHCPVSSLKTTTAVRNVPMFKFKIGDKVKLKPAKGGYCNILAGLFSKDMVFDKDYTVSGLRELKMLGYRKPNHLVRIRAGNRAIWAEQSWFVRTHAPKQPTHSRRSS